jgi:hypothetical protein
MNPYSINHSAYDLNPPLSLATVLMKNAELNARNDVLLASLRQAIADDKAFRQKHLGCDLTIEALQERNEEMRKELASRNKAYERSLVSGVVRYPILVTTS